MGSDVYLCYKKSTAKTHFLSYKPGVYFSVYPVVVTAYVIRHLLSKVNAIYHISGTIICCYGLNKFSACHLQ